MHHLSHITIENFRSCRHVEVPLSAFTPFVGYNNAGKSNLLQAVRWVVAPFALSHSDFYDHDQPVMVTAQIDGISDDVLDRLEAKHRSKIAPLVLKACLRIRRVMQQPGAVKTAELQIFDPLASSDGEWRINPAGIPDAIKALFPEPVLIGAMEDAAEDAGKAKASNTIGKLLAEFTAAIDAAHTPEVTQSLKQLQQCLNADGAQRSPTLQRFDAEASEAVRHFFPGVSLHLDIPVPDVATLLKNGTLKVSEDGGDVRQFDALGHGAQRSIQMAMIHYLAQVRDASNNTAQDSNNPAQRLLLIDEPELYLHPQAVEQVRLALKRLSGHGYQVLFTTHSPMMIDRHAIPATRLVRKSASDGTQVAPSLSTVVERYVNEPKNQLQTLLELKNASAWLFSDSVILVEGKTEARILPSLLEAATGQGLAARKMALLSIDGAAGMVNCMQVLNALGIPCKGIADLDFVVDKAQQAKLLDKPDTDLDACLAQLKNMASLDALIHLGNNGRPQKPPDQKAGHKPSKVVSLWAATPTGQVTAAALRKKLLSQGIWLWPAGDIEHHLGLPSKDEGAWAQFIDELTSDNWELRVSDVQAVSEMCEWIAGASK